MCSFIIPNGKPHIFCLEVYNGNKVGYVEQQLKTLFGLLDRTKKIEQRVGVEALPRLLVTFDNQSLMDKVLARLQKDLFFHVEGIENLMFFNLDTNVRADF